MKDAIKLRLDQEMKGGSRCELGQSLIAFHRQNRRRSEKVLDLFIGQRESAKYRVPESALLMTLTKWRHLEKIMLGRGSGHSRHVVDLLWDVLYKRDKKAKREKFRLTLARQAFDNGKEKLGEKLKDPENWRKEIEPFEFLQLTCDSLGLSIVIQTDEQTFVFRPSNFMKMSWGNYPLAYGFKLTGFQVSRKYMFIQPILEEIQASEEENELELGVEPMDIEEENVVDHQKRNIRVRVRYFEEHKEPYLVEVSEEARDKEAIVAEVKKVLKDIPADSVFKLHNHFLDVFVFCRMGQIEQISSSFFLLRTKYAEGKSLEEFMTFGQLETRANGYSCFFPRCEYLHGAPWKDEISTDVRGLLHSRGEDAVYSSRNCMVVFDGVSGHDDALSKSMLVRLLGQTLARVEENMSQQRPNEWNMAQWLMGSASHALLKDVMLKRVRGWSKRVTTTCTVVTLVDHKLHWYMRGDSLFCLLRHNGKFWYPVMYPKSTNICNNCLATVIGREETKHQCIPQKIDQHTGRCLQCKKGIANSFHRCVIAPQQFGLNIGNFHKANMDGVRGVIDTEDEDVIIVGSDGLWDVLCPLGQSEDACMKELCDLLNQWRVRKGPTAADEMTTLLAAERLNRLNAEFKREWRKGIKHLNFKTTSPKPDDCGFCVSVVKRGDIVESGKDYWSDLKCVEGIAREAKTRATLLANESREGDEIILKLMEELSMLPHCPVPPNQRQEIFLVLAERIAPLNPVHVVAEVGDGHCAFRGFARQRLGSSDKFLEARTAAVYQLCNNRKLYEELVEKEGYSWEKYIEEQSSALSNEPTRVYADTPILEALSDVYQTRIEMYNHGVDDLVEVNGEQHQNSLVRLLYWDRLHFDSIITTN